MSDQIFWYLSRSSGLVAWLASAGSILIGVMIPSRLLGRRPTIPWLTDLHRMLAAMASIFLVVHMASLWFDKFVRFRWADLLIPGVAEVPGLGRTWLALGVIAAWLTAAIELTSLVRDRLPVQLWRTVHLSSYLTLVLGTAHAIATGSDIDNPVVAALGVSALTAVTMATWVRYRRARNRARATQRPAEPSRPARQVTRAAVAEPTNGFSPDERWAPPSRATRGGTTPRGVGPPRGPWAGG